MTHSWCLQGELLLPEVYDIISDFIRYVACMWCKYAAAMETALVAPK